MKVSRDVPDVALSVIVISSGICESIADPVKSVKAMVEVPTTPAVAFKNPLKSVRVNPAKVGEEAAAMSCGVERTAPTVPEADTVI